MQRTENEWCVSDGVTDPNAAGATVAVQIRSDPTLQPLASLPVGFQANAKASTGHGGSHRSPGSQTSSPSAGAEGLEPPTYGFGDRRSTN
jgi:hypothetical protein